MPQFVTIDELVTIGPARWAAGGYVASMDAVLAHQQSRFVEEFLETLGCASADGVYAVDDEQRIVYWSRAAEVLSGRSAAMSAAGGVST